MVGGRLGVRRMVAVFLPGPLLRPVAQGGIVEVVARLVLAAVAAHELVSYCWPVSNGRGRGGVRRSPQIEGEWLMILYVSSLSPYVRKVLAYAGEKGIDLDLQPTGAAPGQPSAEFLE